MREWLPFTREQSLGRSRRGYALIASLIVASAIPAVVYGASLKASPAAVEVQAQGAAAQSVADQRKALQADAAHLLQLATQLKANVDHARKDELSLQVIRQAEEIEKIARSARSRIR